MIAWKVPEFLHRTVLLRESVEALRPGPQGRYVDGTVGGAGHAEAILEASAPGGWLCGLDRDSRALEAAARRLERFAGRFELHRGDFADMERWVKPGSCDGVLLDLGVSSPQLDEAERGFSFQQDGPLDMRMDREQPISAADVVNGWEMKELENIFRDYADEPHAGRLARGIVRERSVRPFQTTGQLAAFIERECPRRGARVHPATRVFQAVRMAVNDELGSLRRGLDASLRVLKPGGRLAVITFHSVEDRLVKHFGREKERDYTFPGEVDLPELRMPRQPELRRVNRKALAASESETRENPRSRSAQLRVFEKI